jgi:hypothetical protein
MVAVVQVVAPKLRKQNNTLQTGAYRNEQPLESGLLPK